MSWSSAVSVLIGASAALGQCVETGVHAIPATELPFERVAHFGEEIVALTREPATFHVLTQNEAGKWTLRDSHPVDAFTTSDAIAFGANGFGVSAVSSSDTIAIGDRNQFDRAIEAGGVIVYRRTENPDGSGAWSVETTIVPDDLAEHDGFGSALALSGDLLVVGAPGTRTSHAGAAHVFERDGTDWIRTARFDGASQQRAGQGVAISSGDVFYTIDGDAGGSSLPSEVMVVRRTAEGWASPFQLEPSGLKPESFGDSLVGDDEHLVAGSREGIFIVFAKSGDAWSEIARVIEPGVFITTIALVDDMLIIDMGANYRIYKWDDTPEPTHICDYAPRGGSFDIRWRQGMIASLGGQDIALANGFEDADASGTLDLCEIIDGTLPDTDCDRIADSLDNIVGDDCDGDGTPDACQIRDGTAPDCDGDGILDSCELESGEELDCNGNGIPDTCDIRDEHDVIIDCNGNGLIDACEIADGLIEDCDDDGIPDDCELANAGFGSFPPDCDRDGILDTCAVADGLVPDLDGNGRPDICDCNEPMPVFDHPEILAGGSSGGAIGDFNNDGWQDIVFAADRLLLYINNGDGTFIDQTDDWGLPEATASLEGSPGVADYDNDGRLDVAFAPRAAPFRLFRNLGDSFQDVTADAGLEVPPGGSGGFGTTGVAWGDANLDGHLDLVFGSWYNLHAYLNNGDGTFTDITESMPTRFHAAPLFSPRWVDFDGDRYPELVVISDFGESVYLRNNTDGTFTDITFETGGNTDTTEMGFTVADYDLDGDFDYYITTISSNNLYLNDGDHQFRNVADHLGGRLDIGGWGWAAVTIDLNHDTWPDLVATDWNRDPSALMHIGNEHAEVGFIDRRWCRVFNRVGAGWAASRVDHDNDGDQDVIFFGRNRTTLVENQTPTGSYLRVFLNTKHRDDIAPNGIGSIVRVHLDDRTLTGRIDGGSNYMSQSELSAHFGLADATVIPQLTVEWTNGEVTTRTNVPASQTLTINAPCASDFNDDGITNIVDLLGFLDVYLDDDADLDDDGITNIVDLLLFLDWYLGCPDRR